MQIVYEGSLESKIGEDELGQRLYNLVTVKLYTKNKYVLEKRGRNSVYEGKITMKEAQSLIDSYSRKHDDVWKSGHHQGSACIRYFDSISCPAVGEEAI